MESLSELPLYTTHNLSYRINKASAALELALFMCFDAEDSLVINMSTASEIEELGYI